MPWSETLGGLPKNCSRVLGTGIFCLTNLVSKKGFEKYAAVSICMSAFEGSDSISQGNKSPTLNYTQNWPK